MGWWGTDLFAGDSICDWQSEHLDDLAQLIDKTIEKGTWYTDDGKRGYDVEDIPGMIFVYAEYSLKHTRRTNKLAKYAEWCKNYKAEGWRTHEEREKTVRRLGEEIEALFQTNGGGYKFDYENQPATSDLIGKTVYHLTRRDRLEAILSEGLKSQECFAGFFNNRKGVYVSTSLLGCVKWQFHVLGHHFITEPAFVKFAISSEDSVYPDLRVDFKDDFVVTNDVAPSRLIAFT